MTENQRRGYGESETIWHKLVSHQRRWLAQGWVGGWAVVDGACYRWRGSADGSSLQLSLCKGERETVTVTEEEKQLERDVWGCLCFFECVYVGWVSFLARHSLWQGWSPLCRPQRYFVFAFKSKFRWARSRCFLFSLSLYFRHIVSRDLPLWANSFKLWLVTHSGSLSRGMVCDRTVCVFVTVRLWRAVWACSLSSSCCFSKQRQHSCDKYWWNERNPSGQWRNYFNLHCVLTGCECPTVLPHHIVLDVPCPHWIHHYALLLPCKQTTYLSAAKVMRPSQVIPPSQPYPGFCCEMRR